MNLTLLCPGCGEHFGFSSDDRPPEETDPWVQRGIRRHAQECTLDLLTSQQRAVGAGFLIRSMIPLKANHPWFRLMPPLSEPPTQQAHAFRPEPRVGRFG